MSGGQRYWNEEAQRWEDATTRPAPATEPPLPVPPAPPAAPPPPHPDAVPPVPPPAYDPDAVPPVPPPAYDPDAGWHPPTTLTAPPTTQPPHAGHPLWWKAAVAAAAAVVGAGTAFAVVKLTGADGSDATRTSATASPHGRSPAPTGQPTGATPTDGTAEASPSASASALPEGYRTVDDPSGFSLAVPDGWQRSERPTGVFYTTGGDHRLLQVFVVTEPGMTPYEAVQKSSENLGTQPAYKEIGLEQSGPPAGASAAVGSDTARLVYAYDSEKLGERRQVVEYAFTADDGKEYAVLAAGPAAEWPQAQKDADTALAAFATH